MRKILQELYECKIYPSEQYAPMTEQYKNLKKQHQKHYTDFKSKLDSSLAEEFDTILDEKSSAITMELTEMFIYGFKLGAKMMIEILQQEHTEE